MNTISQAINQHGAVAVYTAAHRHSGGDTDRGLHSVGLRPKTRRDVWDSMVAAREAMTPDEVATEVTQVLIEMSKR